MTQAAVSRRPRLGFLGLGWIGRHRFDSVCATGLAEIAAVADLDSARAQEAADAVPGAVVVAGLDELLDDSRIDGVVIATPSAQHAEQTIRALEAGKAVFCQKPLGRDGAEVRSVVEAARRFDRLLDVDFCYRHLAGMDRARQLVQSGQLGRIFAAELCFHNAYGPDKEWYYDSRRAGGGCLIDLGVHLGDLTLWMLDAPSARASSAALFSEGLAVEAGSSRVEDYAAATLIVEGGTHATLACSWRLSAGADAVISASFYGTAGGVVVRNLGGSFWDFETLHLEGRQARRLGGAPDDWAGRAILDWTRRLSSGAGFDPAVERAVAGAEALDSIYAAAGQAEAVLA